MNFRIIDVFAQDSQLVVKAEHFHPSGAFWFTEHYIWQGREGLKRQRKLNALGAPLLDDGTPAPTRARTERPDQTEYYLPTGRQWGYNEWPRLSETGVLRTIEEIHQQRVLTGWPQGRIDVLGKCRPNYLDPAGILVLLPHLKNLVGRQI